MRKKKILETLVAIIAAVALVRSGFWVGWSAGRTEPENIVVSGVANLAPGEGANSSSTAGVTEPGGLPAFFWQAWQDINALYLRNPSTTDEQKVQGSVAGLVASLGDPYTEYFAPADNTQNSRNAHRRFRRHWRRARRQHARRDHRHGLAARHAGRSRWLET